jgi:hypothetical protein
VALGWDAGHQQDQAGGGGHHAGHVQARCAGLVPVLGEQHGRQRQAEGPHGGSADQAGPLAGTTDGDISASPMIMDAAAARAGAKCQRSV